jgi:DAACS family dicarboxylate/amino acid:cation (Na+ or H+) symporter
MESTEPAAKRRIPLHTQILIGLLVGGTFGLVANYAASSSPDAAATIKAIVDNIATPVGKIFLRLMMMVVIPLVFSALSLAIVELGDLRSLGRVGLRTLAFTGIFSFSAVIIGIVLVGAFEPGKTLDKDQQAALEKQFSGKVKESEESVQKKKDLPDIIVDMLPENPLQEMVGALDGSSKGNGMLSVMVFSLIVGIALSSVGAAGHTVVGVLQGMFAVSMAVINFAMRLAPYGAGCLIFGITAQLGIDIVITLFWFVMTAMAGFAIHLFVVYPTVIWAFARMRPIDFFRAVREAMVVAFGTSSSNASLPTALRVAKDNLNLPPKIANFVLTVGATGNQNGTALYEGVVVLFLAQVLGVDLSITDQIYVVIMAILAGIGTAGVPGGSIPLIMVLMESVNVRAEAIAIILGVDRILDMCRTVLNVTGDLAVAACVARTHTEPPAEVPEPEIEEGNITASQPASGDAAE